MRTVVRACLVVGVSFALFLIVAPPLLESYPAAYTGVHRGPVADAPQKRVVVDAGSPAYAAGLRTGDTLGCMSLRDSAVLFPIYVEAKYAPLAIRVCAEREGSLRTFTFVPRPGQPVASVYGSLAWAAVRVLVFFTFLAMGSALVILRPGLMTWLFWGYCLGNSPYGVSASVIWTWPAPFFAAVSAFNDAVNALGFPLLLLFALVIPSHRVPRGWWGKTFWATCAVTAAVCVQRLYQAVHAATLYSYLRDPLRIGFQDVMTYGVVLVTLLRLVTMRRQERARLSWVALGIILGVVFNQLRFGGTGTAGFLNSGVLTVVMPLSLMYAILWRQLIDVRFVISRAVVYAIVTSLVVVVIGFVDWATSAYLSQLRLALAIDAVVTVALVLALHRISGAIEDAVDFLVYRKKHAAERYLKRLARTLLRARREDTIDHAIVQDPYDQLELTLAALFRCTGSSYVASSAAGWVPSAALAFEPEHDLVRFLGTERRLLQIHDLHRHVAGEFDVAGATPAVAVPIFEGDQLAAFTIYGLHRDGTKLDPDECETLEALCDTAAQAYIRVENLQLRASLERPLPATT
jgi:hypothetical protein